MEYEIVHGFDIGDLEKEVNLYLQQGWKLQGGVYKDNSTELYLQAMVKE